MKIGLHIFLINLWATLTLAQSVSHAVIEKFGEEKRGIWIRQYEGRMDDLSYTYLVLGYNQTDYKGIVQQKGLEDWEVEGKVNGKNLKLLVTDKNEQVVGFIEGTIQDSLVVATFSDVTRDVQREILLQRVLKNRSTELCGDNKWLKTLSGRLMSDDVQLIMQKEEDNQVVGLLLFSNQNTSYDLIGYCQDEACRLIQFQVVNEQDLNLGDMTFETDENNVFWLQLGTHLSSPLSLDQDLQVICGSRFFKGSRLSYVYPHFDNKRVDQFFRNKANDWLAIFTQENTLEHQEYRYWVDLDYLGEKLISGTINYNVPNSNLPSRQSFILPTDEEEAIAFEDWISDKPKFKQVRQDAVAAEKKRKASQEPESAVEWLEKQTFQHVSMRKEGLCLKTDYSPIFGDRRITLPWSIVEPYLKRFVNLKKYLK